jgi:hypothetical protein
MKMAVNQTGLREIIASIEHLCGYKIELIHAC